MHGLTVDSSLKAWLWMAKTMAEPELSIASVPANYEGLTLAEQQRLDHIMAMQSICTLFHKWHET